MGSDVRGRHSPLIPTLKSSPVIQEGVPGWPAEGPSLAGQQLVFPMSPAEVLSNLGVKMRWQVSSTGSWLGVSSIRKVSLTKQSGKNRSNTAILSTPPQILSDAPSSQLRRRGSLWWQLRLGPWRPSLLGSLAQKGAAAPLRRAARTKHC